MEGRDMHASPSAMAWPARDPVMMLNRAATSELWLSAGKVMSALPTMKPKNGSSSNRSDEMKILINASGQSPSYAVAFKTKSVGTQGCCLYRGKGAQEPLPGGEGRTESRASERGWGFNDSWDARPLGLTPPPPAPPRRGGGLWHITAKVSLTRSLPCVLSSDRHRSAGCRCGSRVPR